MLVYILVVLALFIIPGPAVIITISQTLKGGFKNGVVTGFGIAFGDFIHTVATVLGLSAILMTSALAFEIVKYVGAAYLVFIGIIGLLNKTNKDNPSKSDQVNLNGTFRQAFFIEVLNPKTALFFLAFLPQFVKNDSNPVSVQLLILGLTFVIMSMLYTTFLAILTGIIGEKLLAKSSNYPKWLGKLVGVIYIGLGLKLAFETQGK